MKPGRFVACVVSSFLIAGRMGAVTLCGQEMRIGPEIEIRFPVSKYFQLRLNRCDQVWEFRFADNVNLHSYKFTVQPDDLTYSDCITVKCPIHHNYLLADGSVQQINPEKYAEVQKDGPDPKAENIDGSKGKKRPDPKTEGLDGERRPREKPDGSSPGARCASAARRRREGDRETRAP